MHGERNGFFGAVIWNAYRFNIPDPLNTSSSIFVTFQEKGKNIIFVIQIHSLGNRKANRSTWEYLDGFYHM